MDPRHAHPKPPGSLSNANASHEHNAIIPYRFVYREAVKGDPRAGEFHKGLLVSEDRRDHQAQALPVLLTQFFTGEAGRRDQARQDHEVTAVPTPRRVAWVRSSRVIGRCGPGVDHRQPAAPSNADPRHPAPVPVGQAEGRSKRRNAELPATAWAVVEQAEAADCGEDRRDYDSQACQREAESRPAAGGRRDNPGFPGQLVTQRHMTGTWVSAGGPGAQSGGPCCDGMRRRCAVKLQVCYELTPACNPLRDSYVKWGVVSFD